MKETIIKTKLNFFDGLKNLTKFLTVKKINIADIEIILDKYKMTDGLIIKRLISYVYNCPNILIFINKYMNSLYNQKYKITDFIHSFHYILECNNLLDSRKFFYLKTSQSKDDQQQQMIALFDEYFQKIYDLRFNYKELLFYYNLFLNGIITKDEIYQIDTLIHNGDQTVKLSDFVASPIEEIKLDIPVETIIETTRKNSTGFSDLLISPLVNLKGKNCENCHFFKKTIGPIDGNINSKDKIDVILVNLLPTTTDEKRNQLFTSESIIRKNIELFPNGTRWLMYNLLPCIFKNKSEIGTNDSLKQQIDNCTKNVSHFLSELNAKYIILIGEEVTKYFVPEVNFADTVGVLVNKKYIPVIHPQSMKHPSAQQKGIDCWRKIQNMINSEDIKQHEEFINEESQIIEIKEEPIIKEEIKNVDVLSEVEPSEKNEIVRPTKQAKTNDKKTLLDIKELRGGEILMIYVDPAGNKSYEKKSNKQTGFIKNSNFKECDILTDSVDSFFTMTKDQKWKLIKQLRSKMNMLK